MVTFARICRRGSVVEQLFRKQQVVRSIRIVGLSILGEESPSDEGLFLWVEEGLPQYLPQLWKMGVGKISRSGPKQTITLCPQVLMFFHF